MPDTIRGESITITITYSSFKQDEIDELQKQMPNGILIMGTENGNCADGKREAE